MKKPAESDVGSIEIALGSALGDASDQRQKWIHLLPAGKFQARDGRGPWCLGDTDSVIQSSREYAGQNLIPIDYEHQTEKTRDNGQPAPAAGWIKGLQARTNGLWGIAEWTDRALAHIKNKEYRYLSPVFNFKPNGDVERLLRASLTNIPALELTAIAQAGGSMLHNEELSELKELLGLDANADFQGIKTCVRNLLTARQSALPDPANYVPIGDFQKVVSELQEFKYSVGEETAISAVEEAIQVGRLPPSLRDWGLSLCRANKPAFSEFIQEIGPVFEQLFSFQTKGLPPKECGAAGQAKHLTDEQEAICQALGHTKEEFNRYTKR